MAKIIAICNQKGGTGKTTSAVNICAYFALAGRKVLLVDIDPQGNATSGVGVDKQQTTLSVYNALLEQTGLAESILNTAIPHLSLVPSHLDLIGAEVELVSLMSREWRLKRALEPIKDRYEFIFIDCPPSLGLLTINALTAANSVLIPIQCEYYALEGLSQLAQTMNLIKDNLNPGLDIEGVLLTMADYRTNLTAEVISEARTYFKQKVYQTVIPRNIRLSEAPGFGKPIALYDRHSIGAQKYLELCNEILGTDIAPAVEAALTHSLVAKQDEAEEARLDLAQLRTEQPQAAEP